MNKYLLDTSILSFLMQDSPQVKGHFRFLAQSDYPFICPIVKGEILFGIFRLPAGKKRRDLEQKANEVFSVVPCDPMPKNVEEAYARIKVAAKKQGTPLDECDLWIAATAIALGATLVTSDSDFPRITGLELQIENWLHRSD
jgi:tRNA(fMet)-specific endonuclease VapC